MANYTRKLKQALEKIEQNAQFIETERSKLTLNLTNLKQIEGWESQIKTKGTPLSSFYESWSKLRNTKRNREITNNEALGDYKLPKLKKLDKKTGKSATSDGPVELFPSDTEELETELDKKQKRGKRGGKNVKKNNIVEDVEDDLEVDEQEDVVKEISIDDW